MTRKTTVLLIGSTGNGKSALGNFLLDPFDDERLYDHIKQHFRTSTDLLPHTTETKVVRKDITYSNSSSCHSNNLTVIDTPGLNDVRDFENMIFLMKKLQDLEEINTCIVVVKFDGKIDAQYNETLHYYFKLLPDLIKNNLIIVVTHYSRDEASITRRKKLNIDEEVIKRNILDAVRAACGLSADPLLFMIDSVPAKGDDVSLSVRNEILDYAFNQSPTIPQFKVAKPRSLMQRDRETYDRLVQEATEQSRQTYSNNPALQQELNEIMDAITELKAEKKQWEARKDDKDTEELVEGAVWSTKKKWKSHAVSAKYDLSTHPHKIRNIIKHGSSEVHWKSEKRTDCTLSGKIEGKKFRGMKASITLQIYRRDKYENDIIHYKKMIQEVESRSEEKERERERLSARHESIFKKKSDALIAEARERNQKYIDSHMTLDEAIVRLAEFTRVTCL